MPIELEDAERNLLVIYVQTTLSTTATHHVARREMLSRLLCKLRGAR